MFFTHAMYVCAANVRTGVEIGKKKGYVEECFEYQILIMSSLLFCCIRLSISIERIFDFMIPT